MPRLVKFLAACLGATALLQLVVVAAEWLLWQIHMRRITKES